MFCFSTMSLVPRNEDTPRDRPLVVIRGQEFRDERVLAMQIPIWKATLSKDEFERLTDELAERLTDTKKQNDQDFNETAALVIQTCEANRDDWGAFKGTRRYTEIWSRLDQAATNKQYNDNKRANARKLVVDKWKTDGRSSSKSTTLSSGW